MAWTAPRTWVTGETVTAALMNAHIKDNLLETSAATVTTAGDIAYADAANSMGSRLGIGAIGTFLASTGSAPVWRVPVEDINYADASTSEALDSTTYTTQAGAGPSYNDTTFPTVTATTGTSALVIVSAFSVANDTAGNSVRIAFSVSGATTTAADDAQGASHESGGAADLGPSSAVRIPTLTAGSNTFQMESRVSAGEGTVVRPRILVIPF